MAKIGIIGGTGLIGGHLKHYFAGRRDSVTIFGHTLFGSDSDFIVNSLIGYDTLINLAGVSISGRWTERYKSDIYNSRIESAAKLVAAINAMENGVKPKLLISASAVGYYPLGSVGAAEESIAGNDFLAQVCRDWEAEFDKTESDVRMVKCRFGVVMATDAPAFKKMVQPFRLGVALQFGKGQQHLSWIHIADLSEIMGFIIDNDTIHGAINVVAPKSPTNKEVTSIMSNKFKTFIRLKMPVILLRLAIGQGHILITGDKGAAPEVLQKAGYKFQFADFSSALDTLVK